MALINRDSTNQKKLTVGGSAANLKSEDVQVVEGVGLVASCFRRTSFGVCAYLWQRQLKLKVMSF